MPKYTKEELARELIVVKCNNKEQADYIVAWAGEGVDTFYQQYSLENIYFRYYGRFQPDFLKANPNEFPEYTIIDFAEQFPEYEQTASEPALDPIPTEYAVLTNATESAKKQIAEFEQVLTQIKIDAMKLGSQDLARLIKALKEI